MNELYTLLSCFSKSTCRIEIKLYQIDITSSNNGIKDVLHRYLEIDLLLGAASIPFTVALTTDPSSISVAPVLVAGFVSGLYYGARSKPVRRAGFRTGLVGGVPIVWSSIDFVTSELSAPSDRLALAIVAGALWFIFALVVTAIVAAVFARAGGWVSAKVSAAA